MRCNRSSYSTNTLGQTAYTWHPNQYIFNKISTCVSGNAAANAGDCVDPTTHLPLTFDVFAVNQNFRTPYFFNYNLNVQKSLEME